MGFGSFAEIPLFMLTMAKIRHVNDCSEQKQATLTASDAANDKQRE